jgi:hypothetical protein
VAAEQVMSGRKGSQPSPEQATIRDLNTRPEQWHQRKFASVQAADAMANELKRAGRQLNLSVRIQPIKRGESDTLQVRVPGPVKPHATSNGEQSTPVPATAPAASK